jgi:hypothetical protein
LLPAAVYWLLATGYWLLNRKLEDMSYKNLEIWKISQDIVIDIHKMTLTELPKFELYEEGSQKLAVVSL